LALNSFIKPPFQPTCFIFWNFANIVILVGKKIEKNDENSKKNVNNNKNAKILRSKLERKNVTTN
jgi:hypothetical protein